MNAARHTGSDNLSDIIVGVSMTPGQLIRDARLRHGLSQRRLALRAGTSQAWVSRVECDQVRPSLESLERLLLVLGERLALQTERLPHDDDDPERRARQRAMPMSERLERGLGASAFAAELRGRARRAP